MAVMLALDAIREPPRLYGYVLPSYWRAGVARWWRTWRRYIGDVASPAPEGEFIAGRRDPLPDRRGVSVFEVGGAHACVFSHAGEVAERITAGARQ
jgi:hypothetical protein